MQILARQHFFDAFHETPLKRLRVVDLDGSLNARSSGQPRRRRYRTSLTVAEIPKLPIHHDKGTVAFRRRGELSFLSLTKYVAVV